MQPTYQELSDEERFALEVAFLDESPKDIGHRFFPSMSNSTYYKYNSSGREKLRQKAILDTDYRPTPLALDILPQETMKDLLSKLHDKYRQLKKQWLEDSVARIRLEQEKYQLEQKLRDGDKNYNSLLSQLQERTERFKLLETFSKDFAAFPVDEKLMTAIVALNLIEPAIKKKLRGLNINLPKKTQFNELYDLLERTLLAAEKRKLKQRLLTPNDFYQMRSKIDHHAYDVEEMDKKEVDFIVTQCLKFVNEIFGKS